MSKKHRREHYDLCSAMACTVRGNQAQFAGDEIYENNYRAVAVRRPELFSSDNRKRQPR